MKLFTTCALGLVLACSADVEGAAPPEGCEAAYCELIQFQTHLALPEPPVRTACAIFPPHCRGMYDQLCATRPYRKLCE
jgi:hypothetical protein